MDPITQGLLGATAAQIVGGKKIPKYAWKIGFLAGMAPDLDIVIRSQQNPLLFLEYHRQFTHSLIFIPIGGLIVSLFFLLICKSLREHKLLTFLATTLAYGTHGLLDTTTSYGTVLLWPLKYTRFAWDNMSIVDPIFTGMLLILLILSVLKRSQIIATVSLILALMYMGFGAIQHQRALSIQQAFAKEQQQSVIQARAMPALGNLFKWRGVYRSGDKLYFTKIKTPIFFESSIQFIASEPFFSVENLPYYIKSNQILMKDFQAFIWFTDNYQFEISKSPLTLCDARYFLRTQNKTCMWGIRFPQKSSQQKHVTFVRNF